MLENLSFLFSEINYLAVLVAAIAGMAIASVWYSPKVMGRAWMEESGFDEKKAGPMGPKMIKGFLSNIVLAFGLGILFVLPFPGLEMDPFQGAAWGFGLAVLIHGAAGFPNYAFEDRSVMLFLVHIGNSALGMAAMGAILAAWR